MILDVIHSIEPLPYPQALAEQHRLHARRVAGEVEDTLWFLEHPPVFTTGLRRDQQAHILLNPASKGLDLVETERGGQVTYHGPGQLVGYLFISMAQHQFKLRYFVEQLEKVFIRYLHDFHGIQALVDPRHRGVWVGDNKITAIGLALKERVSFHGFAFNINIDLSPFQWIVPCGIAHRGVTSLKKILGRPWEIDKVVLPLATLLREQWGYDSGSVRQIEGNPSLA